MPDIFGQNRKPGAVDQSLSQGYSLDRFAIDMALRMRAILLFKRMSNLTLIAGDVSTASAVLAEIARIQYDFDAAGFEIGASSALFGISVFVTAGTHQVTLTNTTDAVVLATIVVTNLVPAIFTAAITFPTGGLKTLTVEVVRTVGIPVDAVVVRNAWVEWTSTP